MTNQQKQMTCKAKRKSKYKIKNIKKKKTKERNETNKCDDRRKKETKMKFLLTNVELVHSQNERNQKPIATAEAAIGISRIRRRSSASFCVVTLVAD